MSAQPFWPVTAEGLSTLIANLITIGTFVIGLPIAVRWANRMRQEASAIRRRLGGPSGEVFVEREPLQHILLIGRVRPDDDTIWRIQWSRLRAATDSDRRAGVAKITSPHLLSVLTSSPSRIDGSKSATVVGTVEYIDRGSEKLAEISVPHVHYIDGDAAWRRAWLALRRWSARRLGEIA